MKVTIKQIDESARALDRFVMEPLPTRTAFRVKRVLAAIRDPLKTYSEERGKLLEKYATPVNKDRGEYRFDDPEKRKAFDNDLEDLGKEEVEVGTEKISSDLLSNVNISGADLLALDWLINE